MHLSLCSLAKLVMADQSQPWLMQKVCRVALAGMRHKNQHRQHMKNAEGQRELVR